jgi:simple sugar transport system ATP-binding protein
MLGAEPPLLEHHGGAPGAVVLEVCSLDLEQQDEFGVSLRGVSLQVSAGEVLGVAGVSGNGQNELLAALSGEDRRATPAAVKLSGRDVGGMNPARRRRLGMHFVPEERLGRATVPVHSLSDNALLTRKDSLKPSLMLQKTPLRRLAQHIIDRFRVKARGPGSPARSLSGGNLQKYVVGREIDAQPKLLIVAQPTWGVDVGAAAQIRGELLKLRDAGSALLVVSEELDELLDLSDCLVVIANGRISPRISRRDATRSLLGEWMSGLWPEAGATSAPAPPAAEEEAKRVQAGAPT